MGLVGSYCVGPLNGAVVRCRGKKESRPVTAVSGRLSTTSDQSDAPWQASLFPSETVGIRSKSEREILPLSEVGRLITAPVPPVPPLGGGCFVAGFVSGFCRGCWYRC